MWYKKQSAVIEHFEKCKRQLKSLERIVFPVGSIVVIEPTLARMWTPDPPFYTVLEYLAEESIGAANPKLMVYLLHLLDREDRDKEKSLHEFEFNEMRLATKADALPYLVHPDMYKRHAAERVLENIGKGLTDFESVSRSS